MLCESCMCNAQEIEKRRIKKLDPGFRNLDFVTLGSRYMAINKKFKVKAARRLRNKRNGQESRTIS